MKVCNQYSHHDAYNILIQKSGLLPEIIEILDDSDVVFGVNNPRQIKTKITTGFNHLGWADRVRISNKSKLTISFMKDRVGVCFQLGNVARTYADILKLALLADKNLIDVGIIIVPHQIESNLLGANYARFDRLSTEMTDFSEIIEVPILIIALSN